MNPLYLGSEFSLLKNEALIPSIFKLGLTAEDGSDKYNESLTDKVPFGWFSSILTAFALMVPPNLQASKAVLR